jgi:HEAT repeat protein
VPALTQLAADPRPEIRHEAILALGAIGPDAAPAVPALVKALDDKLVDQAAAFALGLIGTMPADAQAKLRTMINDPDQVLRVTAIWALAKPHKDNQAYMRWATEALVIFLKHPDARIRKAAASALGDLQPPPEITMPIVDAAFKDADDKVVAHAVEAIAGLGPKVVPGLIRALRFERIRPRVAELLGEMGPAAAPAVEALTGLLGDKNPETRKQAAIALAKIGPASKPAVPALIKALEKGLEEEGEVATGAAYALGKIGPDAVAAKPALLKIVEGKDDAATLISAWALGQIAPKDEECAAKAVPVLARGLSDADAKYRAGAAQALKAFGPLAKSAVPALEKAAKDEDQTVQEAAAEALKVIGN